VTRSWRRHPLISTGIVGSIALILIVALFAAPPWPLGRPTSEVATIWIAALAASGTLLAVVAAVWNADEASRNADTATRIAAEAAEREEQARHDAVRPVLSVRIRWATVRFENRNIEEKNLTPEGLEQWRAFLERDGDNGSVTVTIQNDGAHTAVSLQPLLERITGDHREPRYLSIRSPDARYRFNLPVSQSIEIGRSDASIVAGSRWYLTFLYEDALGWLWRSRGLVEFGDTGGRIPNTEKGVHVLRGLLWQDVPLEQPTRLTGLPDDLPN